MITLLTLAFADADIAGAPCREPFVSSTLPAAGAGDVPLDVAPAFIWMDECGMSGSFQFALERDGERLAEERVDADGGLFGAGRLLLGEDLEADTEYLLVITADGMDELTEVLFTTGSGYVQGAGDPELSGFLVDAWDRDDGLVGLSSMVDVTLGEDPDGLSLVLLLDPDGEVLGATDRDSRQYLYGTLDELPEQYCVSAVQEDGSGVRGDAVEICAVPAVEEQGICSTTPLGASMLAGLFGLLLARRRD